MAKSSSKDDEKGASKNRFVVDLGAMALSEPDQRALAAAIQGAVLAHLAAKHPIPQDQVQLTAPGGIKGMFLPDPKPGPYK
jgi:hypothetical protein